MLKNDNGDWVEDQTDLRNMGLNFYTNLYDGAPTLDPFVVRGAFPNLVDVEKERLAREVTKEEITSIIFSMGGWKAPGLDGISAMFYQAI